MESTLANVRSQAQRWRKALEDSENANRALDARCAALQTEIEMVRAHARSVAGQRREWKKERNLLLKEVDKNTTSSILRREELYFTRTNLLKEQLRLRGE